MSNNFSKQQVRDWLRPVRQWLDDEFSLDEVKNIIFNMGLDPDSFDQSNRLVLTQQLAMHIHRRTNLYPALLEAIYTTRPDAQEELVPFGWVVTTPTVTGIPSATVSTPVLAPTPTPAPQFTPTLPTVKEFVNFDLRIYPKMGEGHSYMIEASHDYRGGAGSGLIAQTLDINQPQFQDLMGYLEDLVGERADATELGRALYEFLFPPKVREVYRELQTYARIDKKGIRIRLRVEEPTLNRIPWEYCYHEDDRFFLAKDRNTPFVRHIERGRVPESLAAPLPLKVLLITAEPTNQKPLDIEEEERRMRAILGAMGELVTLRVEHRVSPDKLHTAVTDFQPHVLHFIGHGMFDEQRGEGALCFEQNDAQRLAQPLYGSQLADILRSSSVRLVVLNACKTSTEAEGKAFMGVAPTLVIAGIPAVMAMQFNVPDHMAIRYTTALYQYLVRARPLDEAVTEMRIYASSGPEPYDQVWWAIPTLFMRAEDGVIWQPTAAHAAHTAVLPSPDQITEKATDTISVTKTINVPASSDATDQPFHFSQTISNTGGGININNAGNFNVGGNVTNIGGDQINAQEGKADPEYIQQRIQTLQSQFQPALPQLHADDAADFSKNMAEAATAVPRWSRTRRKLKNALEIAEDLKGVDALLNELETLVNQVEVLPG